MIWGTYESKEHKMAKEKLDKVLTGRNAKMGLYNGEPTYCTVNAYGNCPYCDQCNICHIEDPQAECDDWQAFWESWDEWMNMPEEESEPDYDWGYNEDEGFDPYAGEYTWDC